MTRKFILSIFICFFFFSSSSLVGQNRSKKDSILQIAYIEFKHTEFNFGQAEKRSQIEVSFDFTNTGNIPLLVKKVKDSCGCTKVSWPKKPILPNEKGTIIAIVDSNRLLGKMYSVLRVKSNASNAMVELKVKGEIVL